MKKRFTGIWTLMILLSLVFLPEGMTAKAAVHDSEQIHYFIYFDAANGKLYKTSGFTNEESWQPEPENLEPYTGTDITCKGSELTLHDFYLFPENAAIVIKGNAVLKLEGKNVIDHGTVLKSRYGIYTYDSLTIEGNGSLDISASNAGIYVAGDLVMKEAIVESKEAKYPVWVKGNFTMESGTMTGTAGYYDLPEIPTRDNVAHSIRVDNMLTVNGGVLTGESFIDIPVVGIYAGNLTINGGKTYGHIISEFTSAMSATGIFSINTITVNGGILTGELSHFDLGYGIESLKEITVNNGTVSGYVLPSITSSSSSVTGCGIRAGTFLKVYGGTVTGFANNSSTVTFRSYGCQGGTTAGGHTAITTGSKVRVTGGYDSMQIYDSIQLNDTGHYYIDSESGMNCRYVQFTTPVSGIGTSSGPSSDLTIDESISLDASVIPEAASDQTIIWKSSDDTIASVDENGKVTGHKPGTATITATTKDGNFVKEFTVTVSKKDGPGAPAGVTGTAPTVQGGNDGKLNGVNPSMEYSTNKDFTDAKDCTGNEVTGIPAGTYYVRVKETDTTKAGDAAAVTVPDGNASGGGNSGTGIGSGDSKTDQAVADSLGVSTDTAKQIIDEASKLGVSTDTLLITDTSIKNQKSDADLKGSTFGMLKARTSNLKKNSVTVKWDKVKNADGYILYGNKCGKKNTFKHIKTFTKNSTVKYTQKKLKKGTYYKYLVVAYKNINGVKVTIAASKNVHATTKGGRFGVAKSVKVNKTSKTLAVKKKFKIKASEVKLDKKIKHHRNIKFESDNSRVATVNSKGVVTAKQKGRCYIYVYAQNGVYKRIRITVK